MHLSQTLCRRLATGNGGVRPFLGKADLKVGLSMTIYRSAMSAPCEGTVSSRMGAEAAGLGVGAKVNSTVVVLPACTSTICVCIPITSGAVGAGAFGNDPSRLTSTLANAPSPPTMNVGAVGRFPTYSLLQRGSAPIRMRGFTGVGPMYFTWPTIVPVPPWPATGVDVTANVTSIAAAAAAKENSAFFVGTLFL